MRSVIYARYSSDNQRDASIEDQVRLCRERIERDGWRLVQTYADRAISGSSLVRPGVQALIEDAMAAKFDIIVAEALDRISRDQADVAAFYKRMKFAGISVITLAEGEVNDLHVGLKGTMNALFLQDLAEKTRRGLRGRVEAGRSAGGNSYGYEVLHEIGADGLPRRGARRIDPVQADTVRRIFRNYADGKSPRQIARELNAQGVQGSRGQGWAQSTINGNKARGTGILNNEMYIGRLVWNRQRYIKDPDTGRRVSRLNARDTWVMHEAPELRIVPQGLWNQVKARQKAVKKDTRPDLRERPFWDRRRPRYLFSGLMRCGVCGGGYSKISANLFGCSNSRNKGICTNRLNIRRDVLEGTVLDGLRHHLMDPDLFKEFAEEFFRELNRLQIAESARYDAARDELARIDRRLKKIVDAIAEGVPARTLQNELATLEGREDELRELLASEPTPEPLVHPKLAEVYREKVSELHLALEDEAIRAEAFEIIRSLVDEIVLTPEESQLRVDLKGELAGILALADESRKPAAERRDGPEQIKMVAGVGFEPTTFRS